MWLKFMSALETSNQMQQRKETQSMSAYGRLWWRVLRWLLLGMALVAFVAGVIVGVIR